MTSQHTDRKTLLVTGFEPFGGSTLNPSQLVVEALRDRATGGAIDDAADDAIALRDFDLRTALLPVDTSRIASVLDALWAEHDPGVVLHLGESAKADRLTLERVALNLLDFDTPDNAGRRLVDQPIDPSGPAARFATLPIRVLHEKLESQGIASALSLSAGAYLCNQVLYLSLAHAERQGGRRVGFVHVPSLPEQVSRGERHGASMGGDVLVEQIRCMILLACEAESADKRESRY